MARGNEGLLPAPGVDPGGRSVPARVRAFFEEQIWAVRVRDLPARKKVLYRIGRITYATSCGFVRNRLTIRAAALTYYTVLSVVPFLAFAFAVLKGLGAYDSFIDGTVRPYVNATFNGNAALLSAVDRILLFVNRTNVSTLGALGLLTLLYTSVSLLGSIEGALNEIWGAQERRPLIRQVTNYVALLVTTPLLVVVATSYATAAQSWKVVQFVRQAPVIGTAIAFLPSVMSSVTVGLALFAIYAILPNVRTRPRSALIGAAVGAVLWQAALTLHVRFQLGVAGYNALYSALSAIPIFLVWTYLSWIIVFVGAQVAASHQNERVVRQEFHAGRVDQALKETLAVVTAVSIARDFLSGRPPRPINAIAEAMEVPPTIIDAICGALVRASILVEAASDRGRVYVPARDLDGITMRDVQDALRCDPRAAAARADIDRRVDPELRRVLHAAAEESRASPMNPTLRQLGVAVARSGESTTMGTGDASANAPLVAAAPTR